MITQQNSSQPPSSSSGRGALLEQMDVIINMQMDVIINMLNNVRRACASGSYIIFKIRTANSGINLDSEDSEGSWDDSE